MQMDADTAKEPEKFYWAFISYSRKDERIAIRLHRKIESYSIPRDLRGKPGRDGPVPARIRPVFRDKDELPLSSDLGHSIEDALRASRYLIVVCSPHSAKSKWVNEEVRMFKAMGREDRILAVMVDGIPKASLKGFASEAECFCPALSHKVDAAGKVTDVVSEPIAGDIRKGGETWSTVMMRCLAGITGAGYDAFARREKRRQRRRNLAAGAVVLTAIGAALWVWDYNRLKVSSYANLTERWGLPLGLRKLSDDEASKRSDHYLMEWRQGKLRRVVHRNGCGTAVPEQDEFKWTMLYPNYDERGVLTMVEYRSSAGRLILQRQFRPMVSENGTATQDVAFTRGKEHGLLPLAAEDSSERQTRPFSPVESKVNSQITTHRLTYDGAGRTIGIRYLDPFNGPAADSDGIYGKRMVSGSGALPEQVDNLDGEGNAMVNRHGVSSVIQTSNTWGELETIRRVDALGKSVLLADGYAELRRTFDRNGNMVRLDFFDADGDSALHSDGIASAEMVRDNHGNLTEWRNLDTEGKPIRNRVGVAVDQSKYLPSGLESEIRFLDENGRPVMHTDGIAGMLTEYDEKAEVVRREYRGIADERILNQDGYCFVVFERDGDGNVASESFYGTLGQPVMHRDGFSRLEKTYDKRGNITEWRNYDDAGQPVLNATGFFLSKSVFDRVGNETETTFYGVSSELVMHTDGISRIVRRFDPQGRLERYEVFDTENNQCDDKFGVSRVLYEYRTEAWQPAKVYRYDKAGLEVK